MTGETLKHCAWNKTNVACYQGVQNKETCFVYNTNFALQFYKGSMCLDLKFRLICVRLVTYVTSL